jgi:15-cis-phytoene synthase
LGADVPVLDDLERSRRFCQSLTRRQAGNFYYGLRLLPPEKRAALFALYAYMRLVDDIADADDGRTHEQRVQQLEKWRRQTHEVLAGRLPAENGHLVWHALIDLVRKYSIPPRVFDEVIAGQAQDLQPVAFDAWEQLHQYCVRVAGVVGLACIHIWGFTGGAETEAMALDRGVAFQLTNILRDLREDSSRGRCYLPRDELAALHLNGQSIAHDDVRGVAFDRLMRMQIERAESYYEKSAPLEERISPDSRPTLVAMTAIYHGILDKVSRRPDSVLEGRVSLSLPTKLLIGWRAVRTKI